MCFLKYIIIIEGGSYFYDMVIVIGVWRNLGIMVNVIISIKGEGGDFNYVLFFIIEELFFMFFWGSIVGFVLVINKFFVLLKEIILEYDNGGKNLLWFVEMVIIRDR